MRVNETPVVVKSKELALEIVRLCNKLRLEKKEYSLADQLIRSGTSVGANVREAIRGFSSADMEYKFSIALKEAGETEYWLEILEDSEYFPEKEFVKSKILCDECIRLLVTIEKKMKQKISR